MKPSIVIDGRLLGYRHGGIARYVEELSHRLPLADAKFAYQVALRRHATGIPGSTTVLTPPHHRLERVTLGIELAFRRPSLIHSVDYIQPISFGVPTVITIHDLAFLQYPELVTSESFAYYSQVRDLAKRADAVIVVSEWTKKQVQDRLDVPEQQIHVIHNGVDVDQFSPRGPNDQVVLRSSHPQLGNNQRRPMILFVGTIEPRKRVDLLLDAFENLSASEIESNAAPMLVLAGNAGWRSMETVQRIRELQRTERVIWIRDASNRQLAAMYRAATVTVLPSIDEGFGLPLLESMASGTPVVAAKRGALPEVVENSGVLVDSDSPDDWATSIWSLINDSSPSDLLRRAGIKHASSFSWTATAAKTANVYREVLGIR